MSSEKKVDFWKEEIEEKNKQLKELEAEAEKLKNCSTDEGRE